MTITRTASAIAIVLASWSGMLGLRVGASEDSLTRAKICASADYDQALVLLNQFRNTSPDEGSKSISIERSVSSRSDEAMRRARSFNRSLRRIGVPTVGYSSIAASSTGISRGSATCAPSIARQSYADAKAAFERKEFELAKRRFDSVISLLDDPDVAGPDELKDLRTLSTGFRDLMNTSTAPPVPTPPVAAPPVAANSKREPPPDESIYGSDDPDVVPPLVISQGLPPWRRTSGETLTYEAALALVIDQTGSVTSMSLQGTLQPGYYSLLRDAASQWKYQPATKNGVPVKFRKIVVIRLRPWA
jgi:hypothetical protein